MSRFNPRPRASGRRAFSVRISASLAFQSTPACERATSCSYPCKAACRVSIHARVRAGDPWRERLYPGDCGFQSTPACERATGPTRAGAGPLNVSIHARVRAGDDAVSVCHGTIHCFNPRPRASGRRERLRGGDLHGCVSIHARVRAGDYRVGVTVTPTAGFNPRPRASGRRPSRRSETVGRGFQPPPGWGRATCSVALNPAADGVSIHARVRAGDMTMWACTGWVCPFQSTPACERATSARQ